MNPMPPNREDQIEALLNELNRVKQLQERSTEHRQDIQDRLNSLSFKILNRIVLSFVLAERWRERKEIVEAHLDFLLTDRVYQILRGPKWPKMLQMLRQEAPFSPEYNSLLAQDAQEFPDLLEECRVEGIEAAFSEYISHDQYADAVDAFLKADTWAERKKIIEEREDSLLYQDADEVLIRLLARTNDSQMSAFLGEAREVLELCRAKDANIEAIFAHKLSEEKVRQVVLGFIMAETFLAQKDIVKNQRDILLSDDAQNMLISFENESTSNEDLLYLLNEGRELLSKCRREGIEAAFAEDVFAEQTAQAFQSIRTAPWRERLRSAVNWYEKLVAYGVTRFLRQQISKEEPKETVSAEKPREYFLKTFSQNLSRWHRIRLFFDSLYLPTIFVLGWYVYGTFKGALALLFLAFVLNLFAVIGMIPIVGQVVYWFASQRLELLVISNWFNLEPLWLTTLVTWIGFFLSIVSSYTSSFAFRPYWGFFQIWWWLGKADNAEVQKEWPKALALYQESKAKAEELGALGLVTLCNRHLGHVYGNLGEYELALKLLHDALESNEEQSDQEGIALCYAEIAFVYSEMGQHDKAREWYHKALPIFEALGNKENQDVALHNLRRNVMIESGVIKTELSSEQDDLQLINDLTELTEYELRHYPEHLEKSNRAEELHRLLALTTETGKNYWYETYHKSGYTEEFSPSVQMAWRHAKELFADGQHAKSMGLQCRYALIESSLNSLADTRTAFLLPLIDHQIWSLQTGLAVARQISNPKSRVAVLTELAARLEEQEREPILREALYAIPIIEKRADRVQALKKLVSFLTQPLLREASLLIQSLKIEEQAEFLAVLLPNMSDSLRNEVLDQATTIALAKKRQHAQFPAYFSVLAPYLAPSRLHDALEAAWGIEDDDNQIRVLVILVPHLDEPLKSETLEEILFLASAIFSPSARFEILRGIAPHLTDELSLMGLVRAAKWKESEFFTPMLAALAPYLPEPFKSEALEKTLRLALAPFQKYFIPLNREETSTTTSPSDQRLAQEEEERAVEILVWLTPYLPESLVQEMLSEISMTNLYKEDEILCKLAAYLPESLMPDALARVDRVAGWRTSALIGLAPYLPEHLLPKTVAIAKHISNFERKVEALAGLAPHLPDALLSDALAAALSIGSFTDKVKAVAALMPYITKEKQANAVSAIFEARLPIISREERFAALSALAPYLSPSMLQQAFRMVQPIRDQGNRIEAQAELARDLPDQLAYETLSLAVSDRVKRLSGRNSEELADISLAKLFEIASNVPEPLREKVFNDIPPTEKQEKGLNGILSVSKWALEVYLDDSKKVEGALELMPYLPKPLQDEVLDKAMNVVEKGSFSRMTDQNQLILSDSPGCVEGLRKLAPYLPEAFMSRGLAVVPKFEEEPLQARALAGLTPYVTEPLVPEVLRLVGQINDISHRAQVLVELLPKLPDSSREELLTEAIEGTRLTLDFAQRSANLINMTPYLANPLVAVLELGHPYWQAKTLAGMIPQLPERLQKQAIEDAWQAAHEIQDEDQFADALGCLVPHLPEPRRSEAMAQALSIAKSIKLRGGSWAKTWAEILHGLAPHLSEPSLADAIILARSIENKTYRQKALISLAPTWAALERPVLYQMWEDSLPVLARRTRADLLSDIGALVPVIVALGGEQTMTSIYYAIQDVGQWWP